MFRRVLVVEDEPDMSTLLSDVLQGEYETDSACDSETAIAKLQSFAPDLVILDVILKRGTGVEVLEAVLALPNPPHVLVTTGYASDMDLSRFSKVVVEMIRKPYQVDKLLAIIDKTLNGPPGQTEARVATLDRRPTILVVEDDSPVLAGIVWSLKQSGYYAVGCSAPDEARSVMSSRRLDLILTDWILPQQTGLDLLALAKRVIPGIPVVIMTAFATPNFIRRAMEAGAAAILPKPFELDTLPSVLEKHLRATVQATPISQTRPPGSPASALRYSIDSILGQSASMHRAVEMLRQVAQLDSTVLLLGETGTGKELFAQALHAESWRRHGRFVAINVAAIPESLIESELFGYSAGAFTGARKEGRHGKFVEGNGGTIFLDEIGDLPLHLQAKILRVLEEGEVSPVGGLPTRLNVRFVAATHRNLQSMVEAGSFRSDLFYRLSVMSIRLPALRERAEDIPALAQHFLDELVNRYGTFRQFAPETLAILQQNRWPGNVRELRNFVERAFALSKTMVILPSQLADLSVTTNRPPATEQSDEKAALTDALRQAGGNRTKAAKLLGISRSGLYQKLHVHGIV